MTRQLTAIVGREGDGYGALGLDINVAGQEDSGRKDRALSIRRHPGRTRLRD